MAELGNKEKLAASTLAASQKDGAGAKARPSLKDLLLSDVARTDDLIPARRRFKLRPPPALD
jgi:hypothetical protein